MKKFLLLFAVLASLIPAAFGGESPQIRVFAQHHASTESEGLLRGVADYIHACGDAAVLQARAACLRQLAKQAATQAELDRLAAFWAKQDAHKERLRNNRPTQDQLARRSEQGLPPRLNTAAVDNVSIHWPESLHGDEFTRDRKNMEMAMQLRQSGNYGPDSSAYAAALAARNSMFTKLKEKVWEMDAGQYMAAKRFLRSLAHETRFAPMEQIAGD